MILHYIYVCTYIHLHLKIRISKNLENQNYVRGSKDEDHKGFNSLELEGMLRAL